MYTFSSRIRYSEVDSEGNLSLESLLDYFQDCSTFQSEDLGIGTGYLKEKKMAWVLSAWQIVVERYPKLCEKVSVGTIPYGIKNFIGYRNFLMETEAGERLAYANTIWTLMDMEKRKPVKAPKEMADAYGLGERLDMDYEPRKIAVPKGESVVRETVEIKRHHLDTNHHVNNGQYVRIAESYLPEGYSIRQMRAEYRKQAVLGDKIYPFIYAEDMVTVVSLNNGEGEAYCVTEFKQNQESRGGN